MRSFVAASAHSTPSADGYIHWRKDINSGCSFSDHNLTLDIDVDPAQLSEISYTMTNWDVDLQRSPRMRRRTRGRHHVLNGNDLGILTGANNSWSINSYPLAQNQLVKGTNSIFIDTDAPGTGCWCVGSRVHRG